MSRHWTRYVDSEALSERRKARFFSEHWNFIPGRKRKRRKSRCLPGWTSTHQTNRRRLSRRDRHDTTRNEPYAHDDA